MQVVITEVSPSQRGQTVSNEVHWISDMTPNQINEILEKMLVAEGLDGRGDRSETITGRRYALGLAEDIKKFEEITPAGELVTLGEWLEGKGVEVTKSEKHKIANRVRALYLKHYGSSPRRITRPDAKGNWQIKALGYDKLSDEQILREAYTAVTGQPINPPEPAKKRGRPKNS